MRYLPGYRVSLLAIVVLVACLCTKKTLDQLQHEESPDMSQMALRHRLWEMELEKRPYLKQLGLDIEPTQQYQALTEAAKADAERGITMAAPTTSKVNAVAPITSNVKVEGPPQPPKKWHGFGKPEQTDFATKQGKSTIPVIPGSPPTSLAGTDTYSMVLPLICKEMPNAQLLLSTLAAFTNATELVAIYIITDARELSCVETKVQAATQHIRSWATQKIRILSSESILPELVHVPKQPDGRYFVPSALVQNDMLRHRSFGYIIQMMVKLAIANIMETDYYITLDGDVLCTRPVRYRDFIITTNTTRRAVNNPDFIRNHQNWWDASDAILQTKGQVSKGGGEGNKKAMGVTPAIMHRHTVLSLQRYLESLYDQPWRSLLIEKSTSVAWTEYTLYYTFAVASGLFDTHHLPLSAQERLYARKNMWDPKALDSWDWKHSFDPLIQNDGYFLVTQASLAGHNATFLEHIANQIRPFLPPEALPAKLLS